MAKQLTIFDLKPTEEAEANRVWLTLTPPKRRAITDLLATLMLRSVSYAERNLVESERTEQGNERDA